MRGKPHDPDRTHGLLDVPAVQGRAGGRLPRRGGRHRALERGGRLRGMLVYTDNGIADPWLVSQTAIAATQRLAPLVAVQPVYMHPYTVASMVSSLAYLHGRPVHLNMLAGGFKNDLVALGDETEHDDRYARTVEYTQILMALLRGETVTVDGRWHQVHNLRLAPALPPELMPEVLISGSSPAGRAAAEAIGATPIRYPEPLGAGSVTDADAPTGGGVRMGIIARDDADEAWRVAHERFPATARPGRPRLAMRVSDSHWHHQLAAARRSRHGPDAAGGPRCRAGALLARPVRELPVVLPVPRGLARPRRRRGRALHRAGHGGVRARHPAGGRGPRPRGRGVRPRRSGGPRMTRHLQDLLAASADRHADRPALVGVDETLTYAELDAAVNRVAHVLLAHGLTPGRPGVRARGEDAVDGRGADRDAARRRRLRAGRPGQAGLAGRAHRRRRGARGGAGRRRVARPARRGARRAARPAPGGRRDRRRPGRLHPRRRPARGARRRPRGRRPPTSPTCSSRRGPPARPRA